MQFILLYFDKYEPVVYLALLLIGVYVSRRLWLAWGEWRNSYFGLERELAMRHLGQWAVGALFIFIFACAVFVLGTFIVPGLPASAYLNVTPTVDLLATPFGTLSAEQMTVAATSAPAATLPGSEGCVPGKLEIKSPKPGESVSGKIEIIGTVDIDGMGFYKYEFAPAGSDIWATISADREKRVNQTLGTWFTGALTPGDYRLRLVVTDTEGNALPACIINVRIVGQ
jgi:hypothetical protein